MKNLELFEICRLIPEDTYENVTHIAYSDDLVYVLKNSQVLAYNSSGEVLHSFDPSLSFDCITQFEILEIEKRLWFGTGTQFVCVNIADNSLQVIEQPHEFDAAAWNPAQDSIAVVASSGEVGVYTVDFEEGYLAPLQESHLSNQLGNEFIAVGWGSSDTQFRGRAGKASASTVEEAQPALVDDDEKPRICWRGNGEMFAVNYYTNGKRKFKVFQYPCELIYESEDVVGLQPVIAWRPQGNRIACIVWTLKKCELTMFEKNGFIKDQFELKEVAKVHDLKWSPCGEVLATCQSYNNKHTVNLYIRKNYIWYLKQRLDFPNSLIAVQFLYSSSSMIVIRCANAHETVTYSFKYALHCSSEYWDKTAISCGVINGEKMYLTFCENGLVPPPMYDSEVEVAAPINFIVFHPVKPRLAVIDSTNMVTTFDIKEKQLVKVGQWPLAHKANIALMFHHFVWSTDEKIICIAEIKNCSEKLTSKCILDVEDRDCNKWTFNIENGPVVPYLFNEIIISNNDDSMKMMEVVPSSALYVRTLTIEDKLYVFSLTSTGKFFVNDIEVLQGVISFIIHDKYLFLTTSQNKLMGVRLNQSALNNLYQLNFKDIYIRPVEPGSYLLFGIPQTSSVAMQIPRGNIETCTCQIISVDRLETLIQQNAWEEAMDLVRVEKLVTSTLVDLNVNRFLNNVDKFVQTVESPAVLSDFLLGLQQENVFSTLYRSCGVAPSAEVEGKCELICDRMIEHMEQSNYTYYISCIIIACFVKNSPTSIREALIHVRNLLHVADTEPTAIKIAEEALKSVHTLKSSNEIYQTALAMYDLNLVLFIARNIDMDPREYEPFIYHLKSLDEVLCRFTINDFLKEHGQAVRYLVRCSQDISEISKYVEEHKVYREAYECVEPEQELCKELTKMYAKHLIDHSLYEESAILYLRVSMFMEAFEQFKRANLWKEAIRTMKQLNLSQVTSHQHLRDIINCLIKENRIVEASQIYDQYLSDYESAIALLIDHKLFYEAIELVEKYNRTDIYDSDIYVAVQQYCRSLGTKFVDMEATFTKYKRRLNEIRNTKRAKIEASAGQHSYFHAPQFEDDMLSIAGTNASTMSTRTAGSRTSTMSSRNRRKEERKKQDLRQGGFYEDIALMRVLYDLINEVFAFGPQVRQLCIIGLHMNSKILSDVKTMHNSLLTLQKLIQNCIKNIWPLNLNSTEQSDDLHAAIVHENINSLDVKYRAAPTNLDTSWKLMVLCDD